MVKYMDGYYTVLDLETSVNNTEVGSAKAHWACKDNKIVTMWALNNLGTNPKAYKSIKWLEKPITTDQFPRLIIGHNVKFDLLYLMRDVPNMRDWIKEGRIWDTAHVAYLLSGQSHTFPSLDDLSKQYGLPVKDDRIKTMWDSGMKTEDIPIELLDEYCQQDVENTHKIFLHQLREVAEKGMGELVESQMEFLLALVEMEFNGMFVDKKKLEEESTTLQADIAVTQSSMLAHMKAAGIENPNVNSNHHLNLYLFGGEIDIAEQRPMLEEDTLKPILYKSGAKKGQPRLKTHITKRKIIPLLDPSCAVTAGLVRTKQGIYSLDESALTKLMGSTTHAVAIIFIGELLTYKEKTKELSTYFEGYRKFVWPNEFIHPNFNTTVTPTGRISSHSPNMQNAKRAED